MANEYSGFFPTDYDDNIGTLASSIFVNDNHFFADTTTRDTYFSAHAGEKLDNTYCVVGNELYQYDTSTAAWKNFSIVVRGIQGEQGAIGSAGLAATVAVASSSSNTMGVGSKTFTYSSVPNLGWAVGTRLRVFHDSTHYMEGTVTAFLATTMTMTVDYVVGSGTYALWFISIAGDVGATGASGATTYAELTDKTTADLPAINTPLFYALADKAPKASPTFTGTVSGITKTMVGLGNVNNTSDANKPVSNAQQAALDGKQATLVSGNNIKTINNTPLLGTGNIDTTPTYGGKVYDATKYASLNSCYTAAAIENVSGGFVILVPPNASVQSGGSFVITKNNVMFIGFGKSSEIVCQPGFGITVNGCDSVDFEGLYFNFQVQETASTTITYNNSFYAYCNNLFFYRANAIIAFTGTTPSYSGRHRISNIQGNLINGGGILMDGTHDVMMSNVHILGALSRVVGSFGLKMSNWVEGVQAVNCNFLAFDRVFISTGSGSHGTTPAFNQFTNCYFDGGYRSALVQYLYQSTFNNCWFSNGRDQNEPGVDFKDCTDVSFNNCTVLNSGTHGMYMYNDVRSKITGCNFVGNSVTSGSHYAVYVDASSTIQIADSLAENASYGSSNGQINSVYFASTNSGISMHNCPTMGIAGSPPASSRISDVNATLVASGNTIFPSGSYGINIAHGLPYAPSANDVTITPKGAYPAPKSIGLNSVDATNIVLGTNDNGASAEVWWRVGIFGNR